LSSALARSDRLPNDAYFTPDAVALACVKATATPTPRFVLEPSVGGGAFARAAKEVWGPCEVTGVDIDPDAPGLAECDYWFKCSFLNWRLRFIQPHWVIGNPPFSDAEAHIRHALSFNPVYGAAFLLRLAFLETQKRRAFWDEHRPAEVHVLRRRPSFTGGATDSCAYGWFVWRTGHVGPTTLGWIDLPEST
jgi:hypothetical protein